MRIDWELVRQQKQWLLKFDDEEAMGLLNLLDYLQDDAIDSGELSEAEVFGEIEFDT